MESRSNNVRQASQVLPYNPAQPTAAPDAGIDERNGWHDPDRGNPLSAFDDTERISLCADEMGRLFLWLLFGGSTRNRSRRKPVNQKLKAVCQKRDLAKVLRRPAIIGYRLVGLMLRIRPDLLDGQAAATLARKMRLSRRMFAHYTISFGENFPGAAKTIRRKSRLVNEEAIRQRHTK